MFCNFSFAEQIVMNCLVENYQLKSLKKSDRKRFAGKTIKLLINTEKKTITNLKPQYDLFLLHGVDTSATIEKGVRKIGEIKKLVQYGSKKFNYDIDVAFENEVWSYRVDIGVTEDKARLTVYILSDTNKRNKFKFQFVCTSNTVSGEELILPEVTDSSANKKDIEETFADKEKKRQKKDKRGKD